MILERTQIQRYLRHILIPEISGPGQRKLLDSSIMIYCHSLSHSAQMLYYLTAMGIGHIQCQTEQYESKEALMKRLHSLNPDVKVSINSNNISDCDLVIACCANDNLAIQLSANKNIPIVLAAAAGDRGFLKTASQSSRMNAAIDELKDFLNANRKDTAAFFNIACINLLGNLAAAEAVKAILSIGTPCEDSLQFDLFTYEFAYGANLTELRDYGFDLEQLEKRLQNSKALIIGSGGLGSPVAYMLASMGIGTIGLVDYDTVELSNLNRQILHSTDKIGMPKVKSAQEFLHSLNADANIHTYDKRFTRSNSSELISEYDIVIDALDNLETRYLLNDVCCNMGKTLIEAGVLGFNGLTTNITADKGPCYRCIFPEDDGKNPVPS